MTFAAKVARDVIKTHARHSRDDIIRRRIVVGAKTDTGGTPIAPGEPETVITGILTVTDTILSTKIFGGVEDVDAVLSVLPDVDIEYEDEIQITGEVDIYLVKEIRKENSGGTHHQTFCRLKIK